MSGAAFEKMKTLCEGDRPASGNVTKPPRKKNFKKLVANKKRKLKLKKKNMFAQKIAIEQLNLKANEKNAANNSDAPENNFNSSTRKASIRKVIATSKQNLDEANSCFEMMSKINECGIEGYMLNGRA